VIVQSSGQSEYSALVIMARTECPTRALNTAESESTSAGRRFVAVLSVNGKGTTTTSNAS
jgi:hypothetical protein